MNPLMDFKGFSLCLGGCFTVVVVFLKDRVW